ncbi:MAG: hypothetical protein DMF58_14545, partial [Acidobacteria bacterium]
MLSCSVVFAIDASSRASKARREGESLKTALDALGRLVAELRSRGDPAPKVAQEIPKPAAPAPQPPPPKPAPTPVAAPPP